jgi:hypothetical protein
MSKKPDFKWRRFHGYIIIHDLNRGSMSVTNGIEQVLKEIKKKEKDLGNLKVIYLDSYNNYNEALIDKEGEFIGYETPCKKETLERLGFAFLNHVIITELADDRTS